MSRIFEQLYLGSRHEASNEGWLTSHHITHVVNCAIELPSYFPGRCVYLNLKLDDVPSQSIYHVLEKSFNFILDAIGKGGNVLVHCAAGISRSVSVVVYFIMKIKDVSFDEALKYVKSKREIANPNQGFAYQLISVSPQVISQSPNSQSSHSPHSSHSSNERQYSVE